MITVQRSYKVADATMLVAAATIADNAINNKAFLQEKRSVWKDPFFEQLKKDIDSAIHDYFGVDGAKELRNATMELLTMHETAKTLLSEVKVQIDVDYMEEPARRKEILQQLGYTGNYKKAKDGNQEAMLQLLHAFAKNVGGDLEKELTTNGIHPESIKKLVKLSNAFKDGEIEQEKHKGVRKEITIEGITAFNNIYKRTIALCKIAAKFLKEQPVLQQQFSFSKVAAIQSLKPSKSDPDSKEEKADS